MNDLKFNLVPNFVLPESCALVPCESSLCELTAVLLHVLEGEKARLSILEEHPVEHLLVLALPLPEGLVLEDKAGTIPEHV